MEETDSGDGSASLAPEKVIQPTGPPVQAAQTRLTVFQVRYFNPWSIAAYTVVDDSIAGWRDTQGE